MPAAEAYHLRAAVHLKAKCFEQARLDAEAAVKGLSSCTGAQVRRQQCSLSGLRLGSPVNRRRRGEGEGVAAPPASRRIFIALVIGRKAYMPAVVPHVLLKLAQATRCMSKRMCPRLLLIRQQGGDAESHAALLLSALLLLADACAAEPDHPDRDLPAAMRGLLRAVALQPGSSAAQVGKGVA